MRKVEGVGQHLRSAEDKQTEKEEIKFNLSKQNTEQ